jgi:uncharacterized protein with HEPN domain
MNERDRVRLSDMRDAAREALAFMQGRSPADLRADRLLLLAMVKELEIVGEAATRVSAETRAQLDRIPWQEIVGMRNQLIHVYSSIDLEIVWSTLVDDLPPLVAELERVLT